MFILKYKSFFLSISAILVLVSIFSISIFGLKKSIDFTGGANLVVEYPKEINANSEKIQNALKGSFGEVKVSNLTENSFKLSLKYMKEEDYTLLKSGLFSLSENAKISEFTMKGPSISNEVTEKAILGFILVVLAIIAFITFSFYGVEKPVSSFKYGIITIIALIHDVIIPTGVFAYLGYIRGVEIDSLFVVALLTILGVSVSDTIVVFDRVRENLKNLKNHSFEYIVGMSLNQSFIRSLSTSISVIVVLLALAIFGPESTRYFAITLTIGMFVGTYSSLFVASPLLVLASKYSKEK
jgi:preprotein translocase subunit SecF